MMKQFLAFIICLFIFSSPALADYQRAYSDYSYNFSRYRESKNAYEIAKSTYTTYKTLTSREEIIKQFRSVIQSRDKLMMSYYDLLQEKLLATPAISEAQKTTFYKMKEGENSWMDDHQKKVDAASTLEDLNNVSSDFESHFPQMDTETKQAIGMILLSKEDVLLARWDNLADSLSTQIKRINAEGFDPGLGERGILSAKNKRELASTKIGDARKIFAGSRIDLFSGQQRLGEASQYLREATNYLFEVIHGITG